LNAVAEVGMFEHSLTTDLLNHLVFVQKVFMKVSAVFSQRLVKLKGECERVLLQYSIALFHFQGSMSVTKWRHIGLPLSVRTEDCFRFNS